MAKIVFSQCRGTGSIPCQGTRSHMPQLKILHAETKTQHSPINKHFFKKEEFSRTLDVRGLFLVDGLSSCSPNSFCLFHRFGGFHAFLFKPQICVGFKVMKGASLSYSPDRFAIEPTDLRASQVTQW